MVAVARKRFLTILYSHTIADFARSYKSVMLQVTARTYSYIRRLGYDDVVTVKVDLLL